MLFIMSGRQYNITYDDIVAAVKGVLPDHIDGRNKYFVRIEGRRYPIKQVWSLKTRVPNGGFTADYPKRNLAKLGFDVEEFSSLPPRPQPAGSPRPPESGTKTVVDKEVGQFAVTLEADEDGYITASCPALEGCHSQGRTQQEALANIREAIRGYLASMRKHGEKIPEAHWEVVEVAI